jgi:DNA-binding protein Fis
MNHIARVLAAAAGNQRRAARILGVSRWSLARRLKKYGLAVGR